MTAVAQFTTTVQPTNPNLTKLLVDHLCEAVAANDGATAAETLDHIGVVAGAKFAAEVARCLVITTVERQPSP